MPSLCEFCGFFCKSNGGRGICKYELRRFVGFLPQVVSVSLVVRIEWIMCAFWCLRGSESTLETRVGERITQAIQSTDLSGPLCVHRDLRRPSGFILVGWSIRNFPTVPNSTNPLKVAISRFTRMLSTKNRQAGCQFRGPDFAFEYKVPFEVKGVFVMPTRRLQHMHGALIEVELEILGSLRSVSGKGVYDESDPDVGPALRILVTDTCGDFEFLLPESKWGGRFESSDLPGYEYRISLANCSAC